MAKGGGSLRKIRPPGGEGGPWGRFRGCHVALRGVLHVLSTSTHVYHPPTCMEPHSKAHKGRICGHCALVHSVRSEYVHERAWMAGLRAWHA